MLGVAGLRCAACAWQEGRTHPVRHLTGETWVGVWNRKVKLEHVYKVYNKKVGLRVGQLFVG